MKEFSIEGFSAQLETLAAGMPVLEEQMLANIGVKVTLAAKDKIGDYQPDVGPFEAWQSLADTTKEDRVRKGYSEDDPGLRSGEMHDSIQYAVLANEVYIGSDDDRLLWFELGTDKQPPRSVLGGAAFEQAPVLVGESGIKMEAYLSGAKK
jgi:hypothetical protein